MPNASGKCACLYSTQVSKKRRSYSDGTLIIHHDDAGRAILKLSDASSGATLCSRKFSTLSEIVRSKWRDAVEDGLDLTSCDVFPGFVIYLESVPAADAFMVSNSRAHVKPNPVNSASDFKAANLLDREEFRSHVEVIVNTRKVHKRKQ